MRLKYLFTATAVCAGMNVLPGAAQADRYGKVEECRHERMAELTQAAEPLRSRELFACLTNQAIIFCRKQKAKKPRTDDDLCQDTLLFAMNGLREKGDTQEIRVKAVVNDKKSLPAYFEKVLQNAYADAVERKERAELKGSQPITDELPVADERSAAPFEQSEGELAVERVLETAPDPETRFILEGRLKGWTDKEIAQRSEGKLTPNKVGYRFAKIKKTWKGRAELWQALFALGLYDIFRSSDAAAAAADPRFGCDENSRQDRLEIVELMNNGDQQAVSDYRKRIAAECD